MSSRLRLGTALILPLALASPAAFAEKSPALDRVSIWLGGYYTTNDTTIGASDPSGQFYGNINLEKDLSFDKHKTEPRARLDFLIGDHQGFSFDYYSLNREHSRSISDSLTYGGNVYNASAKVNGKLNFDFGSAAYRWWFGEGNDVFGLGIGAAYYRVDAHVSGMASLNGQSVQASSDYSDSAWAPQLQVGWRHAFNDQWRMYFDASGVKKNGGNLNGKIYNAALGMEWFPWQNVGLGAEYSYGRIKLNDNQSHYLANLDMKVNGPSLFLRMRF